MKSVKPSVDGDDVDKLKEFTDKGESPTQEEETQDFGCLARLYSILYSIQGYKGIDKGNGKSSRKGEVFNHVIEF